MCVLKKIDPEVAISLKECSKSIGLILVRFIKAVDPAHFVQSVHDYEFSRAQTNKKHLHTAS